MFQQLSTKGSDRATAYGMSSRFIRRDGKLLVAWLNAPETTGDPSRAMVGVCDGGTGKLERSFQIGKGTDNHCGPAMVMDGDGCVHLLVGAHHSAFVYRWSDDPTDPKAWSEPRKLEGSSSYPALAVDGAGTLHLAWRDQRGYGSEQGWTLRYRRKPAGKPWQQSRVLAVSPERGYTHWMQSLTVGADTKTLDLVFQFHFADSGGAADAWGRAVAHLRSEDEGATWTHENRPLDGQPLTFESTTSAVETERGEDRRGLGKSNHIVDADGNPWFFCSLPGHSSGVLVHHDGEAWRTIDLAEALENLHIAHGGSTHLTRDVDGRLYFAFYADPDGGKWGWGDPRMELMVATFEADGTSRGVRQVTRNDTEAANWLPALEDWDWTRPERDQTDGPWLMFTRGLNKGGIGGNNRNALHTEVYLTKTGTVQGSQ